MIGKPTWGKAVDVEDIEPKEEMKKKMSFETMGTFPLPKNKKKFIAKGMRNVGLLADELFKDTTIRNIISLKVITEYE